MASNKIYDNMKKSDKFIGEVLAPFEQSFGVKFNKFDKPEDPKYVEPKKRANLKRKLMKAERKQEKLKKLDPKEAKQILFKKAIDKAQGLKDKDDPKIIKKVIKRKDSEKRRHKKKWVERVEKQEEAKKMKEKKKKERIQKARNSKGKKGKKGSKKR